jgi:hypothetical protein
MLVFRRAKFWTPIWSARLQVDRIEGPRVLA